MPWLRMLLGPAETEIERHERKRKLACTFYASNATTFCRCTERQSIQAPRVWAVMTCRLLHVFSYAWIPLRVGTTVNKLPICTHGRQLQADNRCGHPYASHPRKTKRPWEEKKQDHGHSSPRESYNRYRRDEVEARWER
jgi:hypothetical protein